MLTLKDLKEMQPESIFDEGIAINNSMGLNMTGTGEELRWVAVRGGIHDWAIYCHLSTYDKEWIAKHGDKVHSGRHIRMLVSCDDEAFAMYRY